MSLALLDMSRKDIFGGGEGSLGVPRLGFGGRALGARGVSEDRGARERRLRIYYSCLLSGDVFIKHLTVAAF